MPSHAACAPRASTAATPRASPIPPAAITGTGATASTTAGTRGSVAIRPPHCRRPGPPSPAPRSRRPLPRPSAAPPARLRPCAGPGLRHRGPGRRRPPGSPQASDTIRSPASKRLVEAAMLVPRQDQVAAKRTSSELGCLTDHAGDVSGPGKRRQSSAPASETAAASRDRRRSDRGLDDRLLDPEQLADRRTHEQKPKPGPAQAAGAMRGHGQAARRGAARLWRARDQDGDRRECQFLARVAGPTASRRNAGTSWTSRQPPTPRWRSPTSAGSSRRTWFT